MDVTKKQVSHSDSLKQFNAPSQPFHARGRFELVAGCMRGEEGKGLVKKKGQQTKVCSLIKFYYIYLILTFVCVKCKYIK